jgi:hypothetical protein
MNWNMNRQLDGILDVGLFLLLEIYERGRGIITEGKYQAV